MMVFLVDMYRGHFFCSATWTTHRIELLNEVTTLIGRERRAVTEPINMEVDVTVTFQGCLRWHC